MLYLSQHKIPYAFCNYKQSIPVTTAEQFPISEDLLLFMECHVERLHGYITIAEIFSKLYK